ncbi:pyridoxine/pyridoxal/pyridoxamine kinase [Algiphilus aromaticivorans]|uniref:pyridoxine/pyridoxal/pyridoxamine kinase n=1 Tax=Algiphilus aromaticivorans TaxID=382454 RepID=UPI0005C1981E|nr:pyridoxine/pyridoxal/pyridoxamine kinase [Algiphilus aromaticivorans]
MRALPVDVVSVQSQVVYGQVGNNVAVPALQGFGLRVAAVPTVVLSNTPHYPSVHGGALPASWLAGYLYDLRARGVWQSARAVLSGYIGSPEQASCLGECLQALQQGVRPPLILVDPVLGDSDSGLYVDERLPDIFRQALLPYADGLTPNGFELGLLSGMPVDDVDAAVRAARTLMGTRVQWIVVTSAAPVAVAGDEMQLLVVTPERVERLVHRRVPIAPKGTGDLFSATLLGHWLTGLDIVEAAHQAAQAVLTVLEATSRAQCEEMLLPLPPALP